MSDEAGVDSREFRDLMGRFATGVTVVTVRVGDEMRGMTANAFSSVSLDPPLLLVCIERSASAHPLFERAEAFGVNILPEDQREVAQLFAQPGELKGQMADQPYREGALGTPLLEVASTCIECRIWERYPAGDHTIIVGHVIHGAVARPDDEPLLFYTGRYRRIDGSA